MIIRTSAHIFIWIPAELTSDNICIFRMYMYRMNGYFMDSLHCKHDNIRYPIKHLILLYFVKEHTRKLVDCIIFCKGFIFAEILNFRSREFYNWTFHGSFHLVLLNEFPISDRDSLNASYFFFFFLLRRLPFQRLVEISSVVQRNKSLTAITARVKRHTVHHGGKETIISMDWNTYFYVYKMRCDKT